MFMFETLKVPITYILFHPYTGKKTQLICSSMGFRVEPTRGSASKIIQDPFYLYNFFFYAR